MAPSAPLVQRIGRAVRRRAQSRAALLLFGIILGGVLVGGIASAAIPGPGGVISACYNKDGGTLRVIDAAVSTCKSGESLLTWNQTGAPGPQGVPGPTGTQGPQGPAGPAGKVAGVHEVHAIGVPGAEAVKSISMICPPGEVALGGGYSIGLIESGPPAPISVLYSLAVKDSNGKPVGWQMEAMEVIPYEEVWWVAVYAICAPGS